MKATFLARISLAGTILLATLGTAGAQQPREVTIALSSASLGAASPRIAKQLDLFEKHGLSATVVPMDSGATALAALVSKSADGALAGPGTVLAARARGLDIVYVLELYKGFATTMVISKAAMDRAGVPLDAPAEERLKAADGMVIAVPDATSGSTLGFKNAMATVGGEFRFANMAQTAMQAAMESGAVDGYLASAPFWAGPIASGTGVVWISGLKGDLPAGSVNGFSSGLVMLKETTQSDPALVEALTAVFRELRQAIDERPDEVKAAVLREFPDMTPQVLEILYPTESAAWSAEPITAGDLAAEIEFVKRSGTDIPGIDAIDTKAMVYP
jgi:ABC-type nitrate/sulfonate/bicarbonate transport system substrate-binding protein